MNWDYLFCCLAALLAGAINSVAGGGTLLTFPALFAALGYSPDASVIANATSTTALAPASAASAWGYRHDLRGMWRWVLVLLAPSLIGGLIGSALVIQFPSAFRTLVPWLILTAAALFAIQPAISRWLGIGHDAGLTTTRRVVGVAIGQFFIAIYGGYFGAGIGILMLSGLALMGLADIHAMNGLKNLLAVAINGMSVAVFVFSGKVHWPLAVTMAAASIAGGYGSARIARRLNRNLVRSLVVGIGLTLAAYYFYRQLTIDDGVPPNRPAGEHAAATN
ncbi:MAG: sulfite exporter TauE/SafE family protein [Pirellulales bacterium]|nr:sulfite exporter TauE/SafE family protein [Pirellulales bacterium]